MYIVLYTLSYKHAKLHAKWSDHLSLRAFIPLAGFVENFLIQNSSTSQGLPYDFSSIMHFRPNAFSVDYHKSTIVPHNHTIPTAILGSSATATDLDFLHLNLLYCGGTEAKSLRTCHTNLTYIHWSLCQSRSAELRVCQ